MAAVASFVRVGVSCIDDPMVRIAAAVYVAGCRRSCPGCHNPELRDAKRGTMLVWSEIAERVQRIYDRGLMGAVTFLGGDWMLYPEAYVRVASYLRYALSTEAVLYTGETYENLRADVRAASDWVIDGPWDKTRPGIFPPSLNQNVFYHGARVEPDQLPLYRLMDKTRSPSRGGDD